MVLFFGFLRGIGDGDFFAVKKTLDFLFIEFFAGDKVMLVFEKKPPMIFYIKLCLLP
jgi:hypothetical protein